METSQRHRYRRFCLVSVGAAKSWPKRITKNKDISDILNHILVAFCKGYSKYLIFMWYINTDLYHDEHCHAFQFDYSGLTDSQKGYEGVWFNVHMSGYTKGASAMAHEMLRKNT